MINFIRVCSVPTVCPGSSDPFFVVTYYIKWFTTSWTDGINSFMRNVSLIDQKNIHINVYM